MYVFSVCLCVHVQSVCVHVCNFRVCVCMYVCMFRVCVYVCVYVQGVCACSRLACMFRVSVRSVCVRSRCGFKR